MIQPLVCPGRDIQIAEIVDRVARAGDCAQQSAEGKSGRTRGDGRVRAFGIENCAPGVFGGNELIGTAVGQVLSSGLLAEGFIGAARGVEAKGLVFAGSGAQGVGCDDTEMVRHMLFEARDVDFDRMWDIGRAKVGFGDGRARSVGGACAVFEMIMRVEALRIDLGAEVGAFRREVLRKKGLLPWAAET